MENYENLMDSMNDLVDKITDVEESMKPVEVKKLHDQYDRRGIPMGLKYGMYDDMVLFNMSSDAFNQFEYYLGFEYERSNIQFRIEVQGNMIVGYEGSRRAVKLFDAIVESEEDESE